MTQRCSSQRGAAESPQPHAVHPSPAPGGVVTDLQSPCGTCWERRDPAPTVLHKPHPFYTQTQQRSGQGQGESRQTRPCPLAPAHISLHIPAPTAAAAIPCPPQAAGAPRSRCRRLPPLPPAAAFPGRCAALSEISILGCGKVYLRRVRRDPC